MGSRDEARREYLDELVSWLWPGQALVERGQGTEAARRSYVPLPSTSRPTVLVPSTPRPVAAAVLRAYKPSAPLRTRTLLVAAAYGVRAGALSLHASPLHLRRTEVATGEDIEEHLGRVLGQQVVVAPYTSPPRANRKPVLHVLTTEGRTLGFAKVAWNDLTDQLVLAESEALERLARSELKDVSVPTLIDLGWFRGHPVLLQSAVRTTARQRPAWARVVAAMEEVARVAGRQDEDLVSGSCAAALRRRLQDLQDHPSGRELLVLFERLHDAGCGRRVVVGASHGDWTPWNMAVTTRGVALWDWERFSTGVPLGFDALHYQLQRNLVSRQERPDLGARQLLRDAPSTLAPFGVEAGSAPLVALLYLLQVGARLVSDRQAEAGARRGRIEQWLLPVVAEALTDLRPDRHVDGAGT